MHKIKHLHNHAFRWIIIALVSVMFCVLLGGYWKNVQETNKRLNKRTGPMKELTSSLLAHSGSSDNLLGSSIASYESMISGLELTPAVSDALHQYVSNLYTVAGAFDAAKAALPENNDREYLFNKGTISLLESTTYTTGNILKLYSGRNAIEDAVVYLSGAVQGTSDETNLYMSKHNLSVALASQIGIEVKICTESYGFLAQSWENINKMIENIWYSYRNQIGWLEPRVAQGDSCLRQYIEQLSGNLYALPMQMVNAAQLSMMAAQKNQTYSMHPLTCPLQIDLYDDIVTTQQYETNMKVLSLQNAIVEKMLLETENPAQLPEICDSLSKAEKNIQEAGELISQLSGEHHTLQDNIDPSAQASGSYQSLPDDTQELVNDIYQKNIQYIQTMQQTQQDNNYRPLQRLQELFKEFYGDTLQFVK